MIKEDIQSQKEKVKQMTKRERLQYFWYYNKVKVGLGLVAVAFIIYLVVTIWSNKDSESIYVAMVNSYISVADQTAIMDEFTSGRNIDTNHAPAKIHASFNMKEDSYGNVALANSQLLQAYMETGDFDVLIADEWIIKDFASQGMLADLTADLDEETLKLIGDNLYYYTYENGETFAIGFYANNLDKVNPYYKDVQPIVSLVGTSPTKEIGAEYIRFLLE